MLKIISTKEIQIREGSKDKYPISIITNCIPPIFLVVGSITSFSPFAIQTTGKVICPDDTTAEGYSYDTTTTNEIGNQQPATAVELRCVDASGTVVKSDPVGYAFLQLGVFTVIGLVISAILAFLFAAPIGIWIARIINQRKKRNIAATIEVI